MAERIVDATKLNIEEIVFCAPKATAQGSKSVNLLNKATKTGLTLSTPLMLTGGASDYKAEGEEKGNGRFDMALQFPNDEYKTDDTDAFLTNMQALEDKINSNALIYTKEWFGKVYKSAEVVEALWTPMLKYPKDKATGEYDRTKKPTLKVKLPQYDGVWKSEIYDEDGNKLYPSLDKKNELTPLDYLKKGANIMCLIQFAGIWFINGKFSASWKLVQAVVQKPRAQLNGQCFLKLKPQEKEKLKTQVVVEDEVDQQHIASSLVDDSDPEDEDDEVDEEPVVALPPAPPPPAPPPALSEEEPKKKKIIKKNE